MFEFLLKIKRKKKTEHKPVSEYTHLYSSLDSDLSENSVEILKENNKSYLNKNKNKDYDRNLFLYEIGFVNTSKI